MRVKITLPLINYTGPLCGFSFVGSVAQAEDDGLPQTTRNLSRLAILYAGTKVEREGEVAAVASVEPAKSPDPAPAKAPAKPRRQAKAKVLADEDDEKPHFEADDDVTGDDKE